MSRSTPSAHPRARRNAARTADPSVGRDAALHRVQRAHQQFLAGDPVEHEPARVAPYQARGKPFAPRRVPDDLGRRKAFADRVEHVDEHAVEVERAAADEVAHHVGRALVGSRLGSGRDDQLGAGDRLFARAEHRQVVQVLLFHLFGEFEIEKRIAEFGFAQDRDQPFGREPDRRMHRRVDVAHAGHGRRGLFVAQLCGVDLAPVRIVECHAFFTSFRSDLAAALRSLSKEE